MPHKWLSEIHMHLTDNACPSREIWIEPGDNLASPAPWTEGSHSKHTPGTGVFPDRLVVAEPGKTALPHSPIPCNWIHEAAQAVAGWVGANGLRDDAGVAADPDRA